MSVTIEDVACRAGVSIATVSRALRGLPHVAAATRSRVVEAAAQLGYAGSATPAPRVPSTTVGIVVPYVDRWFFGCLVSATVAVLRQAGVDVVLYHLGDEAGRERFFAGTALRRRVDGLVLMSLGLTASHAATLRALAVPVVHIGADTDVFPGVRVDDVAGATKAVRYLAHLGHRDIGFITGERPVPMGFTTPLLRARAYAGVLAEFGLRPRADQEVHVDPTPAGGERAMNQLLAAGRRPTAVFAESDELALGALRALRAAGLTSPEDMSVVGFDGNDVGAALDLTTVAQPVREQGDLAARMLLGELGMRPGLPPQAVLPTHLVIRATTGRPPRRAPVDADPRDPVTA
jgi:LacI family repressor for deo operon, udp, cdd, tsx, nupC, and nupG